MPNFRYRALAQSGELVTGSISAPNAAEVTRRIEFLGLVPIDSEVEASAPAGQTGFSLLNRPRPEEVTAFTRDLAMLLKAGARINDGLDLMTTDIDIGRLRKVIAKIRAEIVAGESFADALSKYPSLFPPIYVALVRIGEASGTLENVLEMIALERTRAETLRRRVSEALRYPAFVLLASGAVLTFFLLFVLPQFAAVLRDFGAKVDPFAEMFLSMSEALRQHSDLIVGLALVLVLGGWLILSRASVRAALYSAMTRLPLLRSIFTLQRAALFSRNLGVLLSSGVALTTTLRILSDMMAEGGDREVSLALQSVRQGGKLSDALAEGDLLPIMAIRMIRIGEETGQLPTLAGRIADFYENKLQRNLERVVGIVGPLAIVTISLVVGGLIVSIMTSLLSVTQVIG